jgi:hypothetical protein
MFVETRILDRQHRVLHDLGDLTDWREGPAFVTEFTDQHGVGREHPHRQLGPVVGQAVGFRQVGVGHGQGHGHQQQHHEDGSTGQTEQPAKHLHDPTQGQWKGRQGAAHRTCIGGTAGVALGFSHETPSVTRSIIGRVDAAAGDAGKARVLAFCKRHPRHGMQAVQMRAPRVRFATRTPSCLGKYLCCSRALLLALK